MPSSALKLEKLVLENFYSYGRRSEIKFDEGVTVIVGENGAGKSSIVRAIYFALLGELPDLRLNDAIHRGRDEFLVSLTLTDGTNRYRVERRRGKRRYDALYRESGGGERLIATGAEEVTRKLAQLVLFSDIETLEDKGAKRAVIDLIVLNQGKLDEIGEALSSARKDKIEFLMNILGLSAYLKAWERMKDLEVRVSPIPHPPSEVGVLEKEKFKVTEDDLEEAEKKLKGSLEGVEKIKKEEEQVEQRIAELASREGELSRSKSELEGEKNSYIAELSSVESQLSKARESLEKLSAVEKEMKDLRIEEEKLEEEVKKAEELKRKLEDLKAAERLLLLEELERNLEAFLESLRDVRARLGELGIEGPLEKLKEIVKEEEGAISSRLRKLEGERALKARELSEVKKLLDEVGRKEGEIASQLREIALRTGIEVSSRDPLSMIDELSSRLSSMLEEGRTATAAVKSEIVRLERAIEELKEARGRCPVCGRELDDDHRSELISKYSQQLESLRGEYELLRKKLEVLEAGSADANRLRSRTGELEALRRRILGISVGEVEAELKRLEGEISYLERREEIFSKLRDSVSRALLFKSSILSKIGQIGSDISVDPRRIEAEDIESVERMVETLKKEASALSSQLKLPIPSDPVRLGKMIADMERELRELEPESKSAELARVREKIKLLEEQGRELRRESSAIEQLEERRSELSSQLEEVSRMLSEVEDELKAVRDELSSLRSRRAVLKERKDYLEALSRSLSEVVYKLKVLLKVRSLYERESGLPSILMKHALKQLRRRLVEVYRRFELSYDEIYVDDSFNISLINSAQNLEVSLDQASGGERVAVYLSFIFAAQRVVAELYGGGRGSGFIVLDEPTNYLDETRVRYLADVLREAVSAGGGAQIIVVTHEESLKDAGDVVLRVRKSGANSIIEEEQEEAVAL